FLHDLHWFSLSPTGALRAWRPGRDVRVRPWLSSCYSPGSSPGRRDTLSRLTWTGLGEALRSVVLLVVAGQSIVRSHAKTPARRSARGFRGEPSVLDGTGDGGRGVGHLVDVLADEDELGVVALALDRHLHDLTRTEIAVEDLLRQRVLQLALDRTAQRPRAHDRVVAAVGEQLLGVGRDLQPHVAVLQPLGHLSQHQVDDLDDLLRREL